MDIKLQGGENHEKKVDLYRIHAKHHNPGINSKCSFDYYHFTNDGCELGIGIRSNNHLEFLGRQFKWLCENLSL
jgi:hypothetical protein